MSGHDPKWDGKVVLRINELGPALAAKAKANGRSLTEEIKSRLRETLQKEGIDTEQLAREWARRSNTLLVLAGSYREANQWAHETRFRDWEFVRGVGTVQHVADRKYIVVGTFKDRDDAEAIMKALQNASNVVRVYGVPKNEVQNGNQ